MVFISTAFLILLLIPTAVARAIQAFRDKNRYDLWTMTVGALSLTLALALAISRKIPPEIDLGVSRRSIQLLMNTAIIGGHFALLLFYYGFVAKGTARKSRVVFEVVLFAVVGLTISSLVFFQPGAQTVFITSSSRLARFAASMAAGGIGSILLAELYRLLIVTGHLVRPQRSWAFTEPLGYHGSVAWIFTHAGSTVLIASLMLPVVVRNIRSLLSVPGKYKRYRGLEALWNEAVSARPALGYGRPEAKGRQIALLRPSRIDFALRSRELTCKDYLADCGSSIRASPGRSANKQVTEMEQ